jgi:hypothetical protein
MNNIFEDKSWGAAVLFWELFLILGICSQLNILKVPDLNRVEYVGFSRDQLAIARIVFGLASYCSTGDSVKLVLNYCITV